MYGYTQQELVGQNIDILHPQEDLGAVRASIFQPLMEKGHVTTERRNKTKSGAEIYIHLTVTMVRDPDSNPVGLVGLSQDITERKLAELALRQTDQKLRGMAQVCPDFFFTTRPDGWTDWVSPKFYEYTGALQGGGDGLLWADYLHPEDRMETGAKWMEAIKRGDPFETEHRFRGRDGEYRWFRSRATTIRNPQGEIERWVGIGSDIHDQKQSEAALRESERRFKTLAESIPHSVWVISPEGFAEYGNQHWLDLTGQSMEQSLGQGWISAIHPDDVAETMLRWEKAAALNQSFEAEYRIRTADGTYRWQLARAVRHKSGDGQSDQWFGTCTDIHDQKMAMEALRQREATLRNFYDHSPFAMGITEFLGDDVLIVYGNPASCQAYNPKPGATALHTLRELGVSPEEMRDTSHAYRECLTTGKPVVTEYLRIVDGRQHWFLETIAPLDTGASGNPRFTFVTKDVTEQKLAEEALRRNEEQFRKALHGSPVVLSCQDKDLRYTWVYNPGLGLEVNQILGRRDIELCEIPKEGEAVERLKRQVMASRVSGRQEFVAHLNGMEKAYDLAVEPMLNASGEIDGVTCTAVDITERRQAEAALRQQQLVLETLIESTDVYIFMKDRQGRYVFINSSAAESVGKTAREIIGKDDTFIFPAVNARQIMEKDKELMAAGKSEVYEEDQPTAGRMRHLLSSKSVCRDAVGEVIGIVGISRDITDLRKAEEALTSSELNAAGARMAHALAHEINNPLAAMTNALYLLRYGTKTFSADELLTSAQDALSRITKITRQMIGLYHRNAPARLLKVEEVVEDTLASMDSRIRSKGIQFEKRLDQCEFNGIETDVRQLVSVLLENAVEHGSSLVRIRLYHPKKPQTGFRLIIADDGPGIPAENREQVFEPFFSTKEQKGSGLGLWVARGIVQKYGGAIRLRSSTREGSAGTCVVVAMPARRGQRHDGGHAEL